MGAFALLGLLVMGSLGCRTAQYYRQAVSGQLQILRDRQPIDELMVNPDVAPELKDKFELVTRLLHFAENQLQLPTDKHYLTYVDLGRRFAVWNVHAAPPFSLEPKKWWYPLVGSLKYRGYFREDDAKRYASQLASEGADVYVEGVEAYSTLGWFADPLLNTFIHHSEPVLAEILFHELAHQRLFISGDTDFNEAFATAVAAEAVRRWFAANGKDGAYQKYQLAVRRNEQFVGLIMRTRERLKTLYGSFQLGEDTQFPEQDPAIAAVLKEKDRIIDDLREDYAKLKTSWGGYSGYDGWFNRPLNNAQLNTVAVYHELVPGFRILLAGEGGDLDRFYRAVENLGKLSNEERRERLLGLAGQGGRGGSTGN